jgi:hypothetical protein
VIVFCLQDGVDEGVVESFVGRIDNIMGREELVSWSSGRSAYWSGSQINRESPQRVFMVSATS